ncbi:hypothetical protein [Geobacter benzoatilyticus]|uniref:Uncharacterized protein n=1 Tax=Geobacter benzoatilyticus TaxID=2815309 RepID=A0ABX7Q0G6_9BACT|nr:hypothetical protein [Geobacter benzoatilyticus]QSV44418.1 hypothetical protein JZM60_09535 [Geobacter benzoatilyticus]
MKTPTFIETDNPFEVAWLAARGFSYEMEKIGLRFTFMFPASPGLEQARKEFEEDEPFQRYVRCRKELGRKMWRKGRSKDHE